MAATRFRRRPTGVRTTPTKAISERDPQTWLALNPGGYSPSGLTYGVLRKTHGERSNSALEFAWRKAHLGQQSANADWSLWSPNAEKVEVLLPSAADDSLLDPATLLALMDTCALERETALLIYMTFPLGDAERVHAGWECARAFARERLARDRQLATLLVLHAPTTINEPFPLHAHCLAIPRQLGGMGLRHGLYDAALIGQGGQAIIEQMWAEHRAAFR